MLFFHLVVAKMASFYYGNPSQKMVVIGVTGTKGKTSTINFIWSALMAGDIKTGIISTANIKIGNKEELNRYHMTMPGGFEIQKLLSKMLEAGCRVCVVEVTSEGIKQNRHTGINFDIAVFTNLTPEHLPSHSGSFENYKKEKIKLFSGLSKYRKIIDGQKIEKIIVVNSDSEHFKNFLVHDADCKYRYSIDSPSDYRARSIQENDRGVVFSVGQDAFSIKIMGRFNVYNALPAIIIATHFGIDARLINQGFHKLSIIPGRMERIDEGQSFTAIVDYAHEKQSMTRLLDSAHIIKNKENKIIVLLGAEGGGRDKSKRSAMGEIVAKKADLVVVSNVDPYDDDPGEIVEEIAAAVENFGKKRDRDLFLVEDRRAGISKALSLAQPGDVVLITGKGAEQSMIIGDNKIAWDDRVVVREELKKIGL